MVTDADQEAHDAQTRARASTQVTKIQRQRDGSAPLTGEQEFSQVVWTRHHRPERAAAEGEPVLTQE